MNYYDDLDFKNIMDFVQKKVTRGAWGLRGTSRTFVPVLSLCSREWSEGLGDQYSPSAGDWPMGGPSNTGNNPQGQISLWLLCRAHPLADRDLLLSGLAGLPPGFSLLGPVPLLWRVYFSKGGEKTLS